LQPEKRLLLHVCCAPDATVVVERMSAEYALAVYFYDPNIHPESEYILRRDEMARLSERLGVPFYEGEYDVDRWLEVVRGLEQEPEGGARCAVCFRMRLERTARFAAEQGCPVFTTVLTVSPHKDADLINRLGQEAATAHGVEYLAGNFKKKDGFKRSLELSREYGLYRQNYCGCTFSMREGSVENQS